MTLTTGLTGIIPFADYNERSAGSTHLRADGLANTTNDFEIWKHGHKYDNLIFQKTYWHEMMEHFKGPKILDLCDPDWINGTVDLIETGNLVNAITCSSSSLTALVKTYFPEKIVVCVPDRLDFDTFPLPREPHKNRAKEIVWFGYIANAHETIAQFAPTLKELGLNLTIISDRPYSNEDEILELSPKFIPYSIHSAYSNIKQADIVINPKSDKAFFKYKSNNKTIISWKLGLPVAETPEELIYLLEADKRNKETNKGMHMVNAEYNILKSASQYREIIIQIRENHL